MSLADSHQTSTEPSPRSVNSEWVKREYQLAVDNKKLIIPVVLEKTPLAEKQFWEIRRIEQVDFTPLLKNQSVDSAL